ncbi:ATP-binding cassette domain-containing protein [Anabaena sp. UHCC 0187]|uniref:ATP-binding cassette domain-containing protein n=1 Tax=Anabaena sp. UHCC 0187 TaxID=2590018 RepID=UPI0014458B40|nr:ATP-binding cassette domain-containing protein [Anabaena sp. UHCC 0187]MTJ11705.1 ATP-binding cassette domain-containing protein [Anabaena sp. UHCC 0187]
MSNSKVLIIKFAKPYPFRIFFTILLGFSGALFNGVGTALIVPIVLKIVGQSVDLKGAPPIIQAVITPFDNIPDNYRLWMMAGAIIFTIGLKNLANYLSSLVSSSLSRTLTSDMREAGLKLLLEIDIDYYTKMKVGDLINSLGGEIGRAASAISMIIKLIIIIITILVFAALLLSISWQLTIASTILLSFVTLVNQYIIYRSRGFGKQLSELSKSYSIALMEILNGIRLVKSTGNEEKEYQRISQLIRKREQADFQSQINSEAIAPISEVTGIMSLMLIVVIGRTLFADQIASLSAVLITYLLLLLRLLPFISQLNSIRSSFANTSSSVDIVADFLRYDNKPLMQNGKIPYDKLQKGIHFNHLCFSYPNHKNLVLQDVDLYLPRGTTLALVGGSGAGKSTMAYLLPRFYDPTSGSITLDGRDLQEFDLKSVRKSMGIVSQDTFLFNDSVRSNIAYAKIDASDEEIITASKRANAYEFISKLPQGFDTMIGDRGVMLSGGQRQRLAIARALLQNPEILILDEATSALDTVSERLVQAALDELSRDRTTLVIAHRLSTVRKADQIAVLDQGCVVEIGTHDELLQKGGYYANLYSMQFANKPEKTGKRNQSLLRISYEIRTQLNSMIGLIQLLIDDLVDDSQEREELIEESYKSVWRILNTIDVFDDVINKQMKEGLVTFAEQNRSSITSPYHNFNSIFEEFRTCLNPVFTNLRIMENNMIENPESQNQVFIEANDSAIYLLKNLEKLEASIN